MITAAWYWPQGYNVGVQPAASPCWVRTPCFLRVLSKAMERQGLRDVPGSTPGPLIFTKGIVVAKQKRFCMKPRPVMRPEGKITFNDSVDMEDFHNRTLADLLERLGNHPPSKIRIECIDESDFYENSGCFRDHNHIYLSTRKKETEEEYRFRKDLHEQEMLKWNVWVRDHQEEINTLEEAKRIKAKVASTQRRKKAAADRVRKIAVLEKKLKKLKGK